jgi:hypothetical protein
MTKFKNLRTGEKLSEVQYYSVKAVNAKAKTAVLVTDAGEEVEVDEKYIQDNMASSVQYDSEKEINRTDAAALFIASPGVVMTVNYNTQVKEKDALTAMEAIYPNKGGKMLSESDYKKKAKEIISSVIIGKERTMIGRHYGSVNEFGRVSFIDMEIIKDATKADYDSRTRQVDPRTINWMIIKGVKYTVKSK